MDLTIQEIIKLSNITNNIGLEDINNFSFKLVDNNIFDFTDAVIKKNFNKSFELLDQFVNDGIDIFSLVGALASKYINMYIVKDADSYSVSDEELLSLLGFKKSGQLYYLRKDSKIYTKDNLKEIILSLCELDKKIKTGYNPVYSMKEFLLSL